MCISMLSAEHAFYALASGNQSCQLSLGCARSAILQKSVPMIYYIS